jgi:nitroreductase
VGAHAPVPPVHIGEALHAAAGTFAFFRSPPVTRGFALPEPLPLPRDLFETIAARRSYREFPDEPLSLAELAGVLRAAVRHPALRAAPLAGLHVVLRRVDGLEPGVYRYDSENAHLIAGIRGDRARELESAGLSQEVLGRAAAVLVWTLADGVGSTDGTRDYRTAQLEAGFGGELAYLAASALGIGMCGVGAFYDDEVNALLAHGERRPRAVYLQALGRR